MKLVPIGVEQLPARRLIAERDGLKQDFLELTRAWLEVALDRFNLKPVGEKELNRSKSGSAGSRNRNAKGQST